MKLTRVKNEEKQAANQQLIKESNLTLIFNLINQHEPVSRAELAHMTKLSPTTVSSLTEELIHNNIIIETGVGTTYTSGRKPILLEVNPDGGYVVSVEMVEDGFNCFVYNLKCKEIDGTRLNVNDYSMIGDKIIEQTYSLLEKNKINEEKLFGICIGIPGSIDYENNRVITSTVIPIDESNDFYYRIKERFSDIPVLIANESSFSAYAEKEFGVPGNINNLIFIDINIGIGAGIILDGKIFNGSFGQAGEIGHISVDINGPKCKCGNNGCLEVIASVPAILQKVVFAVMSGRDTVIKDIVGNDINKISMDVVKQAIDQQDEMVMEVIDDIARKLSYGINNVINLFNPEVIVIGGEVVKLGDLLLEKIRQNLALIGLKLNTSKLDIRYSNIAKNTAILGGARYLLDNIFKNMGLKG